VLVAGDDADHALLVARRTASAVTADVLELEADRPPLEVRRAGGDALPDFESAVRVGARWYVATQQQAGELPASVMWVLDGASAREVVRVPRGGFETRPALRLGRRSDGRQLALVVDGQADFDRGVPMRWIVPLDLETGALADPEPLAPADLADRRVTVCQEEDTGWVVDLPYPAAVNVEAQAGARASLSGAMARLRLSREKACVERMTGSLEGFTPPVRANSAEDVRSRLRLSRPGEGSTVELSVYSARARHTLRCLVR
jgi:hypothetical protein